MVVEMLHEAMAGAFSKSRNAAAMQSDKTTEEI
jgi:hypothetical protein